MRVKRATHKRRQGYPVLELELQGNGLPTATIDGEATRWFERATKKEDRVVRLGDEFADATQVEWTKPNGEKMLLRGYTKDPVIVELTRRFLNSIIDGSFNEGDQELP